MTNKQIKELSDLQLMRYSRHIMLPAFDIDGQEALWNSKVLIIGVGGLGCAVSQYLVASGVGEITLVDDDLVDKTNLQRQVLHRESSVGLNKCASAKQSLSAINSEVLINCIEQRLDEQQLNEQIANHDLVLDCTDNLETRNQLNRYCFKHKTTLVSGAAIRMEGQVSVFSMDESKACYGCLSKTFGEQVLTCSEAGILSPVVGIIGSIQATEAIKVLTGVGTSLQGKLLLLDAATMEFRQFNILKQPNCEVCG